MYAYILQEESVKIQGKFSKIEGLFSSAGEK